MSHILNEDFEYIRKCNLPWNQIRNSQVLVTGATGFIGSLIIRFLDYLNKKEDYNINIIAIVRDEKKVKETLDKCKIRLVKADVCNQFNFNGDIDYIFHCAAITKSKEMIEYPMEVALGIIDGTNNILRLASFKNIKSMVYLSSMEVYGVTDQNLEKIHEENLGFLDLFNVRNCYPLSKRMAEHICFDYYNQYGTPIKIARLAQTFGAGVLKSESRVFMQFANSVLKEEDIVLHTDGLSAGNYCYTADTIIALFTLLFNGKDGEAYNVANEDANMTIKQMAELVVNKVSDGKIKVIYDIPRDNSYGYATPVKMKLSSDKIRKLDWNPRYGMEEMYTRMINYIKEN